MSLATVHSAAVSCSVHSENIEPGNPCGLNGFQAAASSDIDAFSNTSETDQRSLDAKTQSWGQVPGTVVTAQ